MVVWDLVVSGYRWLVGGLWLFELVGYYWVLSVVWALVVSGSGYMWLVCG